MAESVTIPPVSYLTECSLEIAGNPAGEMDATVLLKVISCQKTDAGSDGVGADVEIELSLTLSPSENSDEEAFRAVAATRTTASGPSMEEAASDAAASGYITAAGALNTLLSLSPARGLSLPPLDARKTVAEYLGNIEIGS